MDNADDVVEAAAIGRQARVAAAGELAHDVVPVGIQVHAFNAIARHHHLIHRDFFQVQDREQHVLVRRRDEHVGFAHQRAQLLGGDFVAALPVHGYAERAQEKIGQYVGEPYQRIEHAQQRRQHIGRGEGDALGVERRQRFGATSANTRITKVSRPAAMAMPFSP